MKQRSALWAIFLSVALTCAASNVTAQTATNLICNGCVGASDIANGAVRSGEIANSSIESADIKDGAVKAQDIANNAITSAKILNYAITSVDVAPGLNLGRSGNDGDFTVKTGTGGVGVRLNGDAGNITNLFFPDAGKSNGLVKAWARINENGSILGCWRCNKNSMQTKRLGIGTYLVDFTPLNPDISARPIVTVARTNAFTSSTQVWRVIGISIDSTDKSAVTVVTVRGDTGATFDTDFTIMVF